MCQSGREELSYALRAHTGCITKTEFVRHVAADEVAVRQVQVPMFSALSVDLSLKAMGNLWKSLRVSER